MTISLKKDALSRFKDRFWNIIQMMFYMKVESLLFTNIETSFWTIQNVEWSSVLVYPIYVL